MRSMSVLASAPASPVQQRTGGGGRLPQPVGQQPGGLSRSAHAWLPHHPADGARANKSLDLQRSGRGHGSMEPVAGAGHSGRSGGSASPTHHHGTASPRLPYLGPVSHAPLGLGAAAPAQPAPIHGALKIRVPGAEAAKGVVSPVPSPHTPPAGGEGSGHGFAKKNGVVVGFYPSGRARLPATMRTGDSWESFEGATPDSVVMSAAAGAAGLLPEALVAWLIVLLVSHLVLTFISCEHYYRGRKQHIIPDDNSRRRWDPPVAARWSSWRLGTPAAPRRTGPGWRCRHPTGRRGSSRWDDSHPPASRRRRQQLPQHRWEELGRWAHSRYGDGRLRRWRRLPPVVVQRHERHAACRPQGSRWRHCPRRIASARHLGCWGVTSGSSSSELLLGRRRWWWRRPAVRAAAVLVGGWLVAI